MIGWKEERATNSVISAGGVTAWHEGDFVMVVVVGRWDDVPAALSELAARHIGLIETKPTEEP